MSVGIHSIMSVGIHSIMSVGIHSIMSVGIHSIMSVGIHSIMSVLLVMSVMSCMMYLHYCRRFFANIVNFLFVICFFP